MSKSVEYERELARLLAMFGERALTWADVASAELPEGIAPASVWRLGSVLRYARHVDLPFGSHLEGGVSRDWLYHTRRLDELLQSCLMTGTNNPHVATTLSLPEGRHVRFALLMRDCREAVGRMGVRLPEDRFARLALRVDQPGSEPERLAVRAFRLLGDAHTGADVSPTAEWALAFHDALGVGADPRARGRAKEGSREVLSAILGATAGMNVFLRAVVCLLACMEARPFEAGNALVRAALATCVLRSGGMAFMSWLPVLDFLGRWSRGETTAPAYQPPRPMRSCVTRAGGTLDWTGVLEETLRYCAEEAWWFSNKLTRMSIRRERLERLFAADASHNERQRAVLVEAYVHDDAEFTFSALTRRYGVAYSTAHDDLCQLEREGFLAQCKVGHALYFLAADDARGRILALLRGCDPAAFDECFESDGRLVGASVTPWDATCARGPATAVDGAAGEMLSPIPRVGNERQLSVAKERRGGEKAHNSDSASDASA
jgi:hypothetical protein